MDSELIQRLEDTLDMAEEEEAEETAQELRMLIEDYEMGLYVR